MGDSSGWKSVIYPIINLVHVGAGRFHRSVETIHRYFRVVLKGVFSLYKYVVRLPGNETHPDIRNNRRFYPYFKVSFC